MKKKKTLTALLIAIMCIASLLSFSACYKKEYVPKNQGSSVMTIDNENINGKVVTSYKKYNEFTSSKYANMKLNNFDFVAKKSFYTREFFKYKNLIAIKFNDKSNVKFFINNIKTDGNHYVVTMTRLVDESVKKPTIQSYACFLEVPKDYNVDNAVVDFSVSNKILSKATTIKSDIMSENPLEVAYMDKYDDLKHYIKNSDEKVGELLKAFDAKFFEANALCVLDYEQFDKGYVSLGYIDDTLNIYVYNSKHYAKSSDQMVRYTKFLPIPRGTVINKVAMTTAWEFTFGEENRDSVYTIDFSREKMMNIA